MGVCADRHNEIVTLVAEGLTGAEIAARIGATRSAVLGYCHRRGLALPLTLRKREMLRRNGRAAAGRRRAALPPDHPGRRPRPRGQRRAFTDQQIVRALAAHMGGLSRPAAARLIGCSAESIAKNWLKDEALCAAAREIVARRKAEAACAAERRAQERQAEARRLGAQNAAVFAQMNARDREICQRRIAGETLVAIGGAYGIVKERVRQIVIRWQGRGLIVPGRRGAAL